MRHISSLTTVGTSTLTTAQVNTEADTALSDIKLDHLLNLDGATSKFPEQIVADSIIAKIIAKGDPATPSSYDCTTDSLEALSDKVGAFSGDGGANADDSVKALLDIINTAVGTTLDGIVDNILLDSQIRVAASGLKAITNAQTKWLSIDSGTNGAEILAIAINGLIGAVWTLNIYVPIADAVADTAAADLRSSITYAADGTSGGLISPFAIPFNCFLDFTNGGVAEDNIDQVQVIYRSRGALTLAWEA